MKYIGIIIAILAVIGIAVWLRHAPERTMSSVEPTTPPPALSVESAPKPTSISGSESASAPAPAPAPAPTSPTGTTKALSSKKTTDGMTIEILKEGSGEGIKNGQTASMQYTGTLADGKVFDSTAAHGGTPFSFSLGAGQVIKGWDEGVLGMKVGESRRLIIPSELGYGANGYPGVIPPNATLTFEVTLVAIK